MNNNLLLELSIKNTLITKLQKNVHRIQIESFVKILESLNFKLKDINYILILNNIEYIIKYNILNLLINYNENIYYNIEPITLNIIKKINNIFDDIHNTKFNNDLDLKFLLLEHNIIKYKLQDDYV